MVTIAFTQHQLAALTLTPGAPVRGVVTPAVSHPAAPKRLIRSEVINSAALQAITNPNQEREDGLPHPRHNREGLADVYPTARLKYNFLLSDSLSQRTLLLKNCGGTKPE